MKHYSSEIRPNLPSTKNDQTENNANKTITVSKLFFVGLLGFTAFYATNSIDWSNDHLSLNNLVAQPQLNDHHYNNILHQEFSAHLQKRSKRHMELMEEPEKIHKLHESNVGMGFNMY